MIDLFLGLLLTTTLQSLANTEVVSSTSDTDSAQSVGCQPIDESYTQNLLVTGAVCGPMALSAGTKALSGTMFAAAAGRLGAKAMGNTAVRVGSRFLGAVGLAMTSYDFYQVSKAIPPALAKSQECNKDLQFKRNLIKRYNNIGRQIVAAGGNILSTYERRALTFPTYTDVELQEVPCTQLQEIIRRKEPHLETTWRRLDRLAENPPPVAPAGMSITAFNTQLDVVRDANVRGVMRGADSLSENQKNSLSTIAQYASCLSPQSMAQFVCAIGDLALFGFPPKANIIDTAKAELSRQGLSLAASRGSLPKSILEKPPSYPDRNNGKPISQHMRGGGAPEGYDPVEFSTNRVIEKSGSGPHIHPLDPREVTKPFTSFTGRIEVGSDGRPINPLHYTGITGRGTLYKWGTNYAADAIVTRRNPVSGNVEMLLIQRKDTGEWAFPGGFVDPGEKAAAATVRELSEEASVSLNVSDARMAYQGYVDDPRNTDNAWIETTAMHWHIGDRNIEAVAGDDAARVRWTTVSDEVLRNMYASHGDIARQVLGRIPGN